MRLPALALLVGFAVGTGCALFEPLADKIAAKKTQTYSQYRLCDWQWEGVARVVVMPFKNESENTRAGDEVRAAFSSEFQRLGRFEVVSVRAEEHPFASAYVHKTGEFDEAAVLDFARETRADAIVFGVVTQYSPYHPRPRLGLILQVVSPPRAKVVASVDGLWDTTDKWITKRLHQFYWQRNHDRLPYIRNNMVRPDTEFTGEIATESPALFQRFVCHEAALTLLGLPVPGVTPPQPPDPETAKLWFYPFAKEQPDQPTAP
jgi:hypothetical protein